LKYSPEGAEGTFTGALRGDILSLPWETRLGPREFRRAACTEYVDAYRNLYMRTTPKPPPAGGPKPPPDPNPTKQGS